MSSSSRSTGDASSPSSTDVRAFLESELSFHKAAVAGISSSLDGLLAPAVQEELKLVTEIARLNKKLQLVREGTQKEKQKCDERSMEHSNRIKYFTTLLELTNGGSDVPLLPKDGKSTSHEPTISTLTTLTHVVSQPSTNAPKSPALRCPPLIQPLERYTAPSGSLTPSESTPSTISPQCSATSSNSVPRQTESSRQEPGPCKDQTSSASISSVTKSAPTTDTSVKTGTIPSILEKKVKPQRVMVSDSDSGSDSVTEIIVSDKPTVDILVQEIISSVMGPSPPKLDTKEKDSGKIDRQKRIKRGKSKDEKSSGSDHSWRSSDSDSSSFASVGSDELESLFYAPTPNRSKRCSSGESSLSSKRRRVAPDQKPTSSHSCKTNQKEKSTNPVSQATSHVDRKKRDNRVTESAPGAAEASVKQGVAAKSNTQASLAAAKTSRKTSTATQPSTKTTSQPSLTEPDTAWLEEVRIRKRDPPAAVTPHRNAGRLVANDDCAARRSSMNKLATKSAQKTNATQTFSASNPPPMPKQAMPPKPPTPVDWHSTPAAASSSTRQSHSYGNENRYPQPARYPPELPMDKKLRAPQNPAHPVSKGLVSAQPQGVILDPLNQYTWLELRHDPYLWAKVYYMSQIVPRGEAYQTGGGVQCIFTEGALRCRYTFSKIETLRTHLANSHNMLTYCCFGCRDTFAVYNSLYTHSMEVHGVPPKEVERGQR